MTTTISTSNGTRTLKTENTAPNAKMDAVLANASELLFERGYGDHGTQETPIVFADLSTADKLAILDTHYRRVILDLSKQQIQITKQISAALDADNEHAANQLD